MNFQPESIVLVDHSYGEAVTTNPIHSIPTS